MKRNSVEFWDGVWEVTGLQILVLPITKHLELWVVHAEH
jgi:hypothetical protein